MSKESILLGVCGGIAAYKIPNLVSLLVQQGYSVRIVLSETAARFVSSEVLEAISNQKVYSSLSQPYQAPCSQLQDQNQPSPVLHIALVDEADLFLIAPASYNWIGKAASGIADDLLSTLFAAWPLATTTASVPRTNGNSPSPTSPISQGKPLLFAPTMNPVMWHKQILQQNISHLQQQGCQMIEPGQGFLACRASGQGRMAEPEQLYYCVESNLRFRQHPLAGKRLLITTGPTREALDPVRYISNRSSGKTGVALACAARDLGATVTLISSIEPYAFGNPLHDPLAQQLFAIDVLHCHSAAEMAEHAQQQFPTCDWALAVAAVCDFRPAQYHSNKIKKQEGSPHYLLELVPTSDILAYWGHHKSPNQKVLGFALEDEQLKQKQQQGQATEQPTAMEYALGKLHNKCADAIVLNSPKNLEGPQAQAKLIFASITKAPATTIDPHVNKEEQRLQYDLNLQSKSEFAAELLLLLHQHWL